jgi:phospholipase A1
MAVTTAARRLCIPLLCIAAHSVFAQEPAAAEQAATAQQPVAAVEPEAPEKRGFQVDPEAYAIVAQVRGLSFHRPMYLMPVSYSTDYEGQHMETVFQISGKQRLFGTQWYLAYTQKSFWQAYNSLESSPFRETNYDPELFYRWIPDPARFHHWGADFGFEHESNGRALPDSRSWNRFYTVLFQARGRQLIHLKLWYRVPEDDKTSPEDPEGDDNPDIENYYGYGELRYQRQIGGEQLIAGMLRANPATGRGAVSLDWSLPAPGRYAFFGVSLWHGYGESLIDYNTSVTRVSLGLFFSR